ncbi:MAG TPA: nucleoside transporter [Phycisphaerae bacterium]|nr:nucleoside transporter [Phycisphaerae bacterium]HNU44271.1 nucleoside transporter [Phycisphaerae bacterium]
MTQKRQHTGVVERLDRLYEFDREPVTDDKLCSGAYFAGSYAGEHVAATEFVIGALFVTWGASIVDIVVGLALGNLLAVLSWVLVCAPIAVETRLTLYWYLRRIGGPLLTVIYNVLNALLFCVLAGCMITVSASAVRIPFGIPAQTHWYPTDARFVLTVCLVGAVVVWLAIAGFKRLAAFAAVCSPWMLLMFIVGALVVLPALGESTGVGVPRNLRQFWQIGTQAVWTGSTPAGGPPLIGFWHVAAFAWICNLAMHMGLSDMAIFRYAKRASYGLYSACGMLLGHYLAWIAAGVMGAGAALALQLPLTALDSGAVAYQALGVSGIIAVVIAGWTTSNPTLYRAGLALQVITPDWPRWLVTLVVGIVTTIVACFPFVFTRLLDFVGLYGLLLVPAGGIVMAEHWLFPRLGLTRYWAERRGLLLNWPALLAWACGMAVALGLHLTHTLHLFFLFVPVYVVTVVVYLVLAAAGGARLPAGESVAGGVTGAERPPRAAAAARPAPAGQSQRLVVSSVSGVVAVAALLACVLLAVYVYVAGTTDYAERLAWFRRWLVVPTLLYFIAATVWQVRQMETRSR